MGNHGQGCVMDGLPAQALAKAGFNMTQHRARLNTTPKEAGGKE